MEPELKSALLERDKENYNDPELKSVLLEKHSKVKHKESVKSVDKASDEVVYVNLMDHKKHIKQPLMPVSLQISGLWMKSVFMLKFGNLQRWVNLNFKIGIKDISKSAEVGQFKL